MSDALFDADVYGEATPRRTRRTVPTTAIVETLVDPWVLMTNRQGVVGFHVPKNIDQYSTCVALCGVVGHVVLPPPTQMVRCQACDDQHST